MGVAEAFGYVLMPLLKIAEVFFFGSTPLQ